MWRNRSVLQSQPIQLANIHTYMYNEVMRIGMDTRTRVLEHHGLSESDRR